MRSDFLLFAAILIFVFILWVYSGGPTHPISFAGPYLTPVTNVGGQSEAYGGGSSGGSQGGSSGTIWGNWSSGWNASGSNDASVAPANRSPYAGKVHIDSGASNLGARSLWQEYIGLRASSDSGNVSITGWQLVSKYSGSRVVILQGTPVVRVSTQGPIILSSGDEALIATGASTEGASFKETECTGYLERTSGTAYYPSLSTYNCPSPGKELNSYQSGSPAQYNQCADYVQSLPSCQLADTGSNFQNLPTWCQSFVTNQLTYNGCVRAHQSDTNFFQSTWRIFVGQNHVLWRSSGDTITLLDQNEKVVDQYSY